jgi:ribosomal protein S3
VGQKINPIIFRLGFNKIWKTEFFEKKNNELPLYIFKDLEIRNYIERFLRIHGIIVNDYKQHYNGSTLNLYISYFVTSEFLPIKSKEKIMIKNTHDEKKIVKNIHNSEQITQFLGNKKIDYSIEGVSRPYTIKQYLNSISSIELLPSRFTPKKSQERNCFEGVFHQIFEVLNLFSNKKLNMVLNFRCINKDLHYLKTTQKKTLMSLQKFRNTLFFKECIKLLFHVVHTSNSANLLAQFIASQLKKTKRHKFFLSFLKQTLVILLNSNLSEVKGIKVTVNGRLNGVPRASNKTILIGDVPAQTISVKLDYVQTTIHNSSGSYGLKVWVIEK